MRNTFQVNDSFVAATIRKEIQEVRTLTLDYTKLMSRLGSDTISTSTWVEDSSDITIDSESETTLKTTVTVSGGNGGNDLFLENTVVTAAGLTLKRAIKIEMVEIGTPTLDY